MNADKPSPDNKNQAAPRLWRGKPVVRYHAMVKPIGPTCNLDCKYCYYLSKEGLLDFKRGQRMSDEMLEATIKQHIEGQNYKEIIFSWQGGEPTMLGLEFFEKVVAFQQKHCPKHMRCENDLQTNGTLIDDEWCAFLKEHDFLVGLSIDGPQELHDYYRKDRRGEGSFSKVMNTARLLRKHGVKFATLSCVNRLTSQHPLEVYRFLRDQVGAQRMQFIPIVEPKIFRDTAPGCWPHDAMPRLDDIRSRPGFEDSIVEDWCCDPVDFGDFLIAVFDEWLAHDLGRIYVNHFDCAVEQGMGRVSPLWVSAPMCGTEVVIEHDGSVYQCDHFVYPEFRLGNISETPLGEMAISKRQESFAYAKDALLPEYCRQCPYEWACVGECPKNRFLRTPDGQPGLNYLCKGLKKYFAHIDPHVQRIARQLGAEKVLGAVSTGGHN